MGRTAPAVETVSGKLVDGEGRVTAAVEESAVVVPGTDAVDGLMLDDGATPDGGTTSEEGPTGGTTVSAGGAGGMTVVASGGGPFRGAVTVDWTEVTGGAGGGGGAS